MDRNAAGWEKGPLKLKHAKDKFDNVDDSSEGRVYPKRQEV